MKLIIFIGLLALCAAQAPSSDDNTDTYDCVQDKIDNAGGYANVSMPIDPNLGVKICDDKTTRSVFKALLSKSAYVTPTCASVSSTTLERLGCSAGLLVSAQGEPVACPAGYFCTGGTDCAIPCPLGSYCPSPGEYSPTTGCTTNSYFPNNSTRCGGQILYNNPCPEGSFCSTPATEANCPSGYFCRAGSYEPHKCPPLTICPEGTSAPTKNLLVIIIIIAIILFLVIFFGSVDLLLKNAKVRKMAGFHTLFDEEDGNGAETSRDVSMKERLDIEQSYGSTTSPTLKPFLMEISFRNLGLKLKMNGDVVLKGVSGRVRAGRVTAIMGPSGAGKTTFLNTLCGKASYGDMTGELFVNGEAVTDLKKYQRCMGFVPQEDVMIRNLTVRETLQFYARMRLPPETSSQQRRSVVEQTIKMLRLPMSTLDKKIGDETERGISGGQRKRVNIGIEVVADPTVLFLDEPTSGLDSTTSLEVVGSLKDLAHTKGVTVVAVLHQPRYEIFRMFDDVILLAPGGEAVYIGPTAHALTHFETLGLSCPGRVNPADFYMDVISGRMVDDPDALEPSRNSIVVSKERLVQAWNEKSNFDPLDMMGSLASSSVGYVSEPMCSFGRQIYYFWRRALIQEYRQVMHFAKDLVYIFAAGCALGLLFLNKVTIERLPPVALMTSIAVGLTASLSALRCFGNERVVFWRESSFGINRFAYYLGKLASQLLRLVLAPALYQTLFAALTSLAIPMPQMYAILIGAEFAGAGFGYFVSTNVAEANTQTAVAFGTLCFCMLGGLSPKIPELGQASFITWISPTRWTMEAFYVADSNLFSPVYYGDVCTLTNQFGYKSKDYLTGTLCLFALGFIFRILAFLGLVFKDRDKQV